MPVKSLPRFVLILAGCLMLTACSTPPSGLSDVEKEGVTSEVQEAMGELRRYYAESRWDSVSTFYSDSPDFRVYENGELQYPSAEAVRTALEAFPAGTRLETEFLETEIRPLSRHIALVGTRYETTMLDPSGSLFSWSGALTMVWIKESESWRIINSHSSSPVRRQGY